MKLSQRSALALVLFGYVCLALAYSAVNPLFESPDEYLHYEFVRHLLDHGELPVQTPGKLSEFHQPPLYYALTAFMIGGIPAEPFTPVDNPFWGYDAYRFGVDNKARFIHSSAEAFPYQGVFLAAHVARGVSIVLGALSVLVCYFILHHVFWRPVVALGALAFVAFNPQFLFISSSISNDNLITLLGLLIAWQSIGIARYGLTRRRTLIVAVLIALAVLTKLSAVILALVPVAVIVSSRAPWRKRVGMLLLMMMVVGVLTAGWFLRNQQLYDDWTGIRTWQQIWGWETGVTRWSDIGIVLHNTWTSFWGQFGLGQIVLPDWLYTVLLFINLLSLVGLAIYLFGARKRRTTQSGMPGAIRRQEALIVGLLLTAMIAASIWYGLANPTGAAGRFLLPASVSIAGLLFWGLRSLYRPDRPDLDRWFALLSYGAMIALSVGVLVGVIAPAYAAPAPTTTEAVRTETRQADIQFGDAARLLGYALDRNRLAAGEELRVTLCWQTLRPTSTEVYFFLHLLDAQHNIVARRESLPGLGRYPSTQWSPDRIFCDQVPLRVSEDTPAAAVYDLEIGVVDLANGLRLPPRNTAGVELRPAILERVKVRPPQPLVVAATTPSGAIDLGEQFRLTDSTVTPPSLRAGDTLSVTLVWQARRVPEADYTVFVHLRDAAGNIVAQADSPPQAGAYPTSFWDANETVVDDHAALLPPDLPTGDYRVVVGLYRFDTGERLPITQGGSGYEIVLPHTIRITKN
jgi:4-amino-4-deoxy-L-arabinose transferase-like glycosyltransferase